MSAQNISAKSREEALVLMEEGHQQFLQGDYAGARSSFKEALGLDPGNRQIKLSLDSVPAGIEYKEHIKGAARNNEPTDDQIDKPVRKAANATSFKRLFSSKWWIFGIAALIILVNVVVWGRVLMQGFGSGVNREETKTAVLLSGELKLQGEPVSKGQPPQDLVILTVPASSLPSEETFTVSFASAAPELPQSTMFTSIGTPVQVESTAAVLRQPVQLEIRYDASQIPEGYDANSLQVARWNGEVWDIVEKVSVSGDYIKVSIDHFSNPVFRVLIWNKPQDASWMAQGIEDANRVFFKAPDDKSAAGLAADMYGQIVKQIASNDMLRSLSESDREYYWIAFNLWADALYKSGDHAMAGTIYLYAVKTALDSGVKVAWNDQLLTSPGYALDALQRLYPLGINLRESVRSENWASKIQEDALTLSPESPNFAQSKVPEFDLNQLPPAITKSILDYEAGHQPTGSISTNLGILILSPAAQASQDLTYTLDNKIKPFLLNSGLNIPSTSLEGAAEELMPSFNKLLNQNPPSNRYMIDPVVPGEELHTHSPMIVLKLERAWVNYSGLITHSQHLFAINQLPATGGEVIGEIFLTEKTYRLANGKIETADSNSQWVKIGQTQTENIKTEQLYDEKSLAVGSAHACVVTNLNGIQCWGKNESGQLGTGDTADQPAPVNVKGLNVGIEQIVAGDSHTCALNNEGVLYCWGSNALGQVGNGSQQNQLEPQVIQVPDGGKVRSVAAGAMHTCALTNAGNLYCWGNNGSGQLGTGGSQNLAPVLVPKLTNFKSIAAGGNHTCVLLIDGAVQCWGNNDSGQLGNGSKGSASQVPVTVRNLPVIASLTAGEYHTCAVTVAGGSLCWGMNGAGQLGTGSGENSLNVPMNVQNLPAGILSIKSFKNHTCAIKDSAIDCWGQNTFGQLGNGKAEEKSTVPVQVNILKQQFVSIGTGKDFTCVRTKDGLVYCWGNNEFGQLGNRSKISTLTPVAVDGFGTLIVGADKNMRITPAIGNVIELGKKVQIQVVEPGNNPKSISYWVSYDGQPWAQIARKDGSDTSAAEWDSTGSALDKKVSFKIIIEAMDGTTRETSEPAIFTIVDTIAPSAVLIIYPPEKIKGHVIELGDTISFAAYDPTDTINDVAGSGVKEIKFSVLEDGVTISDPQTLAFVPGQLMKMDWPSPSVRKRNKTTITFRLVVIDNAGNEYKEDASGYSLQDTIPPTFSNDIQVEPINGTNIEMGSNVKLTVNLSDEFPVNKQGSGVSEVIFEVAVNGGEYEEILPRATFPLAPVLQTATSGEWTTKEKPLGTTVKFKVTVKDVAGLSNYKETVNFTLDDTTPPVNADTASMKITTYPDTKDLRIEATGIQDGLGSGISGAKVKVTCNGTEISGSPIVLEVTTDIEGVTSIDKKISDILPEPTNCAYDSSIKAVLILSDKKLPNANVNENAGSAETKYLYDVTPPSIENIVIKDQSGKIVDDTSPITSSKPYTIDVTVTENELGGSDVTKVHLSVQCNDLSAENSGTLDADSKPFNEGVISFEWTPPPTTKDCGYSTLTRNSEFKFSVSADDKNNTGLALEPKPRRINKIDEKDPKINSIKINGVELPTSTTTLPPVIQPFKIEIAATDYEEDGGSGVASYGEITGSGSNKKYIIINNQYNGPYPCGSLQFNFLATDNNGNTDILQLKRLSSSYPLAPLTVKSFTYPEEITALNTAYPITAVVNEPCGGINKAYFTLSNNKEIIASQVRDGTNGIWTISANWIPDQTDENASPLTMTLMVCTNDVLNCSPISSKPINFNIFAINNIPLTTNEDIVLKKQLSASNPAKIWEISVQAPLESGKAIIDADTGMLTFTPALNYFTTDLNNPDKFTVRATNNMGETDEKEFQIVITAVNDAPTSIELSSNSISEGVPSSRVGFLSTVDLDSPANTFTYYLAPAYLDNDNFLIIGNELWTKAPLVANTYHIYIRSTGSGNEYFEKPFDITVP